MDTARVGSAHLMTQVMERWIVAARRCWPGTTATRALPASTSLGVASLVRDQAHVTGLHDRCGRHAHCVVAVIHMEYGTGDTRSQRRSQKQCCIADILGTVASS